MFPTLSCRRLLSNCETHDIMATVRENCPNSRAQGGGGYLSKHGANLRPSCLATRWLDVRPTVGITLSRARQLTPQDVKGFFK
jgi:hypothetical protein